MQRKMRWAIWMTVALALAPAAGGAELEKGTKELALSLLVQDTSDAGFYLNGTGRFGFLVTSQHEVGALVSALYVRPDSGGTIKAGSLGPFYRFNFATTTPALLPFVGLAAYSYLGDLRDSVDWGWQAESGLRVLVSAAASVNVATFWKREYINSPWVTGDRVFGLTVGLSLFL